MSSSVLTMIILLSTKGQTLVGLTPQGCTNTGGFASCDFNQWSPPLLDKDFGPVPLHYLHLYNINGTIPAAAFSGLNGSLEYIYLDCHNGKTRLTRDIFTKNLYWVSSLQFRHCYLENDLPSRLLESLKNLKDFIIYGGGIEGLAQDTLAGLTSLQTIVIRTSIRTGNLPPCIFDGLTNLTVISLISSGLNDIPPNWFNGLVNLRNISLTNNSLQTLPSGLFDGLISLTYVDLDDNPWSCYCELMWLLNWSNITDGGVCDSPSDMQSIELEVALKMLNCTLSTSTIQSIDVSSETEITETQTSSIPKCTVCGSRVTLQKAAAMCALLRSMVSSIALFSRKEWIDSATTLQNTFAMSVTSTAFPLTLTTTSTSKATRVAGVISTSTTQKGPTASSIADRIGLMNSLLNLSSMTSAPSAATQAVYSSRSIGFFERKRRNNKGTNVIDVRNAFLY